MPETATETSLIGKTIRWIFDDGATGGGAYEHTFNADGSVEFRKLDESKDSPGGSAGGKTTREKKYGSFEVAPGVTLVSYLGSSGYTLTIAMNFETGTIHGFASNDKEWHPVSGKLEIVK